ncbi:MAG: hypothetical protein AABZ31_15275 [Bdellovibrionota bacterium]
MFKHLVLLLIVVLVSQPGRAETFFVQTKKHGAIEFTAEAYKEFQNSNTIKKSIQLLIKKKKCEAGRGDLASSHAVHYSYACVIGYHPHPLILFSTNQKDINHANFYVDLLDDEMLTLLQKRSEYQIAAKDKAYASSKKNGIWYRLTIVDVQDPKIVNVDLSDFDSLLKEIEELVVEKDSVPTGRRQAKRPVLARRH